MRRGGAKGGRRVDPAEARLAGFAAVRASDLFGPLFRRTHAVDIDAWGIRSSALRRGGLLAVDAHGGIVYNGRADADVAAWVWSISHVLTHLGLGHTEAGHRDGRGTYSPEWRAACCLAADRFLEALHMPGIPTVPDGFDGDEEQLASRFATAGVPPALVAAGPAGTGPDLWEDLFEARRSRPAPSEPAWGRLFAAGLDAALGVVDPGSERSTPLGLPAPPWDTRLAAWLDERIPVLGRGQAAVRRLAAAPDSAHTGRALPALMSSPRTFGIVLDTSGSMDAHLLGRALASVASSATARDVPRIRVVYGDSTASDGGWVAPCDIAPPPPGRCRRAPVLQPAVDVLLGDPSFPADRPILLITGGGSADVRLRQDHAWLTSGHLPFAPRGPVFHLA